MKVRTHHQVNITLLTRGTVFGHKGFVSATWDDLVNEFGMPLKSEQPGSRVEWQLTILDGLNKTFLTIYDLHSRQAPEDLEVWAVAGIRGADIFTPLLRLGFKQINDEDILYG